MHRSVLQDRAYIGFAERNTVDVIAMEEMDRALEEGHHVGTYEEKDAYGEVHARLVRFDGLTVEELKELSNGPAVRYMQGGRVPYTAFVDPHTLEEMEGLRGLVRSRELIDAAKRHLKTLRAVHGPGADRGLWGLIEESKVQVDLKLARGDVAGALGVRALLLERTQRAHEALRRRAEALGEFVLDYAARRLDALEERVGAGKAKEVVRELATLARALEGTELAERAAALAK